MTLNLVPTRSSQKVYTHVKYEDPNSYQSKDMANVNLFEDKQKDGSKTICPRSIDVGPKKDTKKVSYMELCVQRNCQKS